MKRIALTQEYFVLTINEKGKLPFANTTETKAGLVAAGIMDLLLAEAIKVDHKKIEVVKALPDSLSHLAGLYAYLDEKTRSITRVIEDYCMSFSNTRINGLTVDTGASLKAIGATGVGKGLLGNKELFVPEKEYKEALIAALKAAVMGDEALSLHDIALISLLKETKNLKQYFSRHENEKLKERLETIKNQEDSRMIREMVKYIEEIMTVVMAAVVVSFN